MANHAAPEIPPDPGVFTPIIDAIPNRQKAAPQLSGGHRFGKCQCSAFDTCCKNAMVPFAGLVNFAPETGLFGLQTADHF